MALKRFFSLSLLFELQLKAKNTAKMSKSIVCLKNFK